MRLTPFLAVVAIGFLAACVPDQTPPTDTGPVTDPMSAAYASGSGEPRLSPEAASACTAAGGIVRVAGMYQGEVCVPAASDAGEACTAATDCDGWCMAETGTCSALVERPGCMQELLDADGVRQIAECAD